MNCIVILSNLKMRHVNVESFDIYEENLQIHLCFPEMARN